MNQITNLILNQIENEETRERITQKVHQYNLTLDEEVQKYANIYMASGTPEEVAWWTIISFQIDRERNFVFKMSFREYLIMMAMEKDEIGLTVKANTCRLLLNWLENGVNLLSGYAEGDTAKGTRLAGIDALDLIKSGWKLFWSKEVINCVAYNHIASPDDKSRLQISWADAYLIKNMPTIRVDHKAFTDQPKIDKLYSVYYYEPEF